MRQGALFGIFWEGGGAYAREVALRRAYTSEQSSGRADFFFPFFIWFACERESFLLSNGNCAGTAVM